MCNLTANQKRLVQLVEEENLEQAAAYVKAGYAGNDNVQVVRSNVQNELNKPHVAAYRSELKAKLQTQAEKGLSITRHRQNQRLEKIIKESMDGSFKQVVVKDGKGVIKLNRQGEPLTEYSYLDRDLPTAIRAIQELSKLNGLYEPDKVEHSMNVTAMTEQDIHAEFERLAEYDTTLPNDE